MLESIPIVKIKTLSLIEQTVLMLLICFGIVLTFLFGLFWFDPANLPQNFMGNAYGKIGDILIYALLSYVVWHQIINELFVWIVSLFMRDSKYMPAQPGHKVAFLTAFVPGKEPYDVLDKTLKAMVDCEYPHETWLLDEGNDEIARKICEKHGVLHYTRKGLEKYNTKEGKYRAKTKAGNYNSWCHQYEKNTTSLRSLMWILYPKRIF